MTSHRLCLPQLLAGVLLSFAAAVALADQIVPTRLLRAWDPVTVFFDVPQLLAPATARAALVGLVKEWPEHPGAFAWLDDQTLQFRPAEPWPAFAGLKFVVGDAERVLHAALDAPLDTQPKAQDEALDSLDQVVLNFRQTPAIDVLRQQLQVEMRNYATAAEFTSLDANQYAVKQLAQGRSSSAAVVVMLSRALAPATELRLRLALTKGDANAPTPVWEARYRIVPAFAMRAFGCDQQRFPTPIEGAHYAGDSALRCSGATRQIVVEFSHPLAPLNHAAARNLVRVSPQPEQLKFAVEGKQLRISGDFVAEQNYSLELRYTPLADTQGRLLDAGDPARKPTRATVAFKRRPAFLQFAAARGIVERFGAREVPLKGRHDAHADVRLHRIDPLDRSLWPFPAAPVSVDESIRPPGPGEEPVAHHAPDHHVDAQSLAAHVRILGSPDYSALVELPLAGSATAARFGLDLTPLLQAVDGHQMSGTYLLGIRRPGVDHRRSWMRVQVTDLSLSTVSNAYGIGFFVSSLRSGAPVSGARVEVEGYVQGRGGWHTLARLETNSLGYATWSREARRPGERPMRIVVRTDDDMLTLDPTAPRERFSDNQWLPAEEAWLSPREHKRRGGATQHCHLFSDRPVYKPDEPVHIKGWIRTRAEGRFAIPEGEGKLVIYGPRGQEWQFPYALSINGTFYHEFDEADLVAGEYWVDFQYASGARQVGTCGGLSFRKEDYRLPDLEVLLSGPDRVRLDRPFELKMLARYYAGGRAIDRPLEWKVTQFPYAWSPTSVPGFAFNSRAYFGRDAAPEADALIERTGRTSDAGDGSLTIDPRTVPAAGPRRYVVEAVVSGDDGREVTATREILGLPGVALGVKMPTVVKHIGVLTPQFVAVGADGEFLGDHPVTMRLYRRDWHTQLRATDFSSGIGKYVTEPVDTLLSEQALRSVAGPKAAPIRVEEAGVYIVEFASKDALGRRYTVRADFFVAGERAVSWSKPPAKVLKVSADKSRYEPGDTAQMVVQSPYRDAHVLMVAEAPDGVRYRWQAVRNGTAVFDYQLPRTAAPRLAVHFLLMRGRGAIRTAANSSLSFDLGRPSTLAATRWLDVAPSEHELSVSVELPATARPGARVEATIRLRDASGHPRAGEVTMWLVDQAVLALGRERRLSPMRDFVVARPTQVRMRDTRNELFGFLPFAEYPGGGSGDTEARDLLDQVTPRKRLVPVAYYAPTIAVGQDGIARVSIDLPDNLTVFKLRAKAVSGAGRFGVTTGALAVRLPLLVQPQLPRFVRPGDELDLGALVRATDGTGGATRFVAEVDGLRFKDANSATRAERALQLGRQNVVVVLPALVPEEAQGQVALTMAVERAADLARDALSLELPVRSDRRSRHLREMLELSPGTTAVVDPIGAAIRPGSLSRTLVASTDPGVMGLVGASSFMLRYPYACTEQRISTIRAGLALKRFGERLRVNGDLGQQRLLTGLAETFKWIEDAIDERELVAFWPGGRGYVSLTAWTLQFAIAVRNAGLDVPEALEARLAQSLRRALRSDFPGLLDGAELPERTWALAALADAGLADEAYAAELARRAQFLPLENVAQVLRTLSVSGATGSQASASLLRSVSTGMRTQLVDGDIRYLGLNDHASGDHALARILPSETRTIASILRALLELDASDARIPMLRDALTTLGRGDGWGTTNANASALDALADAVARDRRDALSLTLKVGDADISSWRLQTSVGTRRMTAADSFQLGVPRDGETTFVRVDSEFMPAGSSASDAAQVAGFAVTRDWFRVSPDEAPMTLVRKTRPAEVLAVSVGDVIEERIEVVNASDRYHVAVEVPLAAGLEPMNPDLATARPDAEPSASDTLVATSKQLRDDVVRLFFDYLPQGHHTFRFRVRAVTPGTFTQPPARAEAMYDATVHGNSLGARVSVSSVAN